MWHVSHLSSHINRTFCKNRRATKQYGVRTLMIMQDMWRIIYIHRAKGIEMREFLLFLSLVTPAIIYTSMAHAKLSTEGFGSEGAPYQSAVFEYAAHSNNIKSATVIISPSESGLQRLYFMLSTENENMCTTGDASTYSNQGGSTLC